MDHMALLEQYKLYVQMADQVSDRRMKTNQFYMTLLSSLLVVLSFVFNKDHQAIFANYLAATIFGVGVLGCIICLIWWVNINSYRQLNSQKYAIIHEMEKELAYPCYTREWELLGRGVSAKKYLQLSRVEKWIPFVVMVPYLVIVCFGISRF